MKKILYKKNDDNFIVVTPNYKSVLKKYEYDLKAYEEELAEIENYNAVIDSLPTPYGVVNDEGIFVEQPKPEKKKYSESPKFISELENIDQLIEKMKLEKVNCKIFDDEKDLEILEIIKNGIESICEVDGKVIADKKWEHKLMPVFLIKKEDEERTEKEIEEIIDTDPVKAFQLERKLRKRMQKKSDLDWYEEALIALDARLAKGKPDKPKVRKKLQDKINEILESNNED